MAQAWREIKVFVEVAVELSLAAHRGDRVEVERLNTLYYDAFYALPTMLDWLDGCAAQSAAVAEIIQPPEGKPHRTKESIIVEMLERIRR